MHGLNFLDPIPRRVRLGFTLRFVPEQTLRRLHGNRKLQRLKRFTTNRSLTRRSMCSGKTTNPATTTSYRIVLPEANACIKNAA
jgi:hypothetical protein